MIEEPAASEDAANACESDVVANPDEILSVSRQVVLEDGSDEKPMAAKHDVVTVAFSESRASFAIEREADCESDIKRFAAALAEHCGRIEEALSTASLMTIQNVVRGSRALRTGIRKSPVFVGAPTMHSATVVHYIAPPASELGEMMQGLRAFERRTRGASSLLRAGALSRRPQTDGP